VTVQSFSRIGVVVATIGAAVVVASPNAFAATLSITADDTSVNEGDPIQAVAHLGSGVATPATLRIKLLKGANCSGDLVGQSRLFGDGDGPKNNTDREIKTGGGNYTFTVTGSDPGTYSFLAELAETGKSLQTACSSTVTVVGSPAPSPSPTPKPTPVPGGATCAGVPATIVGTNKGETIFGTSGNDVIVSKGGDDVVNGRGGNDLICGGDGKDILRGSAGKDVLYGGRGNDDVQGGAGDDELHGDGGSDRIVGGPGNDHLHGGPGNDGLDGGKGSDFGDGGPGTDVARSIERTSR
jgi:Ca2+-binding RTX toxin-like protein